MSARFEKKRVLVTGAAGLIGRALTERFSTAGAEVLATDLATERLDSLARDVRGVTAVSADLTSVADVDRVMEHVSGGLDILCNVAGVGDGLASVEELSDEEWAEVITLNLTVPFWFCRRAVPLMLRNGGGVIINMGSVAGLRGGRSGAAYTASKWGLVGFSQNIASTLGAEGVRCHVICPSAVDGSITLGRLKAITERGAKRRSRDAERPNPISADAVASLALFLASDEGVSLNGAAIPVDAGWISY